MYTKLDENGNEQFVEQTDLNGAAAGGTADPGVDFTSLADAQAEVLDFANVRIPALEAGANEMLNGVHGEGLGALTLAVASYFDGQGGAGYLHLKLPYKKNEGNMVCLSFRGYGLYASSRVFNDVASCYQSPNSVPAWIDVKGEHEPFFYIGSDDHLYCRLTVDNFYYLTLSVDSTRVGNGDLLTRGSCEFIRTATDVETL